ncbi:MAG TPA: twin-arginine translocase TatA/TatE family subunit [Sphingomicrobium sp.]|jgi:sec-independent protein translocase protein TatA|nr:twin-arginine translocase TatA/TatE family subunit [Sphingomicrobium sp.]
MGSFSLIHWIILAVIILLLFGGNRFSAMMGDVAKGLKSFKQGMADDDDANRQRPQEPRQLPPQQNYNQNYQQPPIDLQAQPRNNDAAGATPPPPADDNAR